MVFNELLGNGGTAELVVSAEEHVQAGFDGGDPVHTLVFIKTLVLNGHRRVDHGLGNLIQRGPLAVGGGINLLQLLNITVMIHIINKGSPFQIIILHGPVGSFRKDIILQVITQNSHKDSTADQNDQQHRGGCADGDFRQGPGSLKRGIEQLDQPVGLPLLPGLLHSPFKKVFFRHRGTSKKQGKAMYL